MILKAHIGAGQMCVTEILGILNRPILETNCLFSDLQKKIIKKENTLPNYKETYHQTNSNLKTKPVKIKTPQIY